MRFISDQEEQAIIGTLQNLELCHAGSAVKVLIDTGMRIGELYRLKPANIHLSCLTVHDTKTNRFRTIPMTKRVREILCEWLVSLNDDGSHIVPLPRRHLEGCWEVVRIRLGYVNDPDFVLPSLRYTFASRLLQRGVNPQTVQQLLGHRSLATAINVSHLAPQLHQDAVSMLEPKEAQAFAI